MKENYKHKEAFCIMLYKCEDCNHSERLWNSRDGVTPFMILCSKCNKGLMKHICWSFDKRIKSYSPKVGERIFIDMTFEKYQEYKKGYIDENWETGEMPMCKVFNSKEHALQELSTGFYEGMPDVIKYCAETPKPAEQNKNFKKVHGRWEYVK